MNLILPFLICTVLNLTRMQWLDEILRHLMLHMKSTSGLLKMNWLNLGILLLRKWLVLRFSHILTFRTTKFIRYYHVIVVLILRNHYWAIWRLDHCFHIVLISFSALRLRAKHVKLIDIYKLLNTTIVELLRVLLNLQLYLLLIWQLDWA